MKERPIIFNDEMVRAILDGRKTQTRRIVKLPVIDKDIGCELSGSELAGSQRDALRHCPHGQPGNRLWVREAWRRFDASDECGCDESPCSCPATGSVLYRASHDDGESKWKPSIHMPRWASRITLEITGVKVEQLNDISDADAIAEGPPGLKFPAPPCSYWVADDGRRKAFRELWESICGPGSWDANPWVWVIEFRRVP